MDKLTHPGTLLGGFNTIALIAVFIYLHKKDATLQGEIDEAGGEIDKISAQMGNLTAQIGNLLGSRGPDGVQYPGLIQALDQAIVEIKRANKKRTVAFQNLKVLVESLADDIASQQETNAEVFESIQEALVGTGFKGDITKGIRKHGGTGGKGSRGSGKKQVTFSPGRRAKREADNSESESDASEESDDGSSDDGDHGKRGKKKGGAGAKGKGKSAAGAKGGKAGRKGSDGDTDDEDPDSVIARVRGAKK